MKKLCSFLIAAALLLAMLPQVGVSASASSEIIASGTRYECEYDWTLTSDGTLTIAGEYGIDGYAAPWLP